MSKSDAHPRSGPFRRCRRPGLRAGTLAFTLATLAWAPAGAEVETDGVTVRVTKADCLRLVKHEPDADVEYRPGTDLDSDGNPVVSPYLYGQPRITLPETVDIPIEVDLDERYGLPPDASFEGDAYIGTVEVDVRTGRASFNGRPLVSDDEAALQGKCVEVLHGDR